MSEEARLPLAYAQVDTTMDCATRPVAFGQFGLAAEKLVPLKQKPLDCFWMVSWTLAMPVGATLESERLGLGSRAVPLKAASWFIVADGMGRVTPAVG